MSSIRSADGTRIEFEQTPGTRPVLLLHGFASNSALTWEQTGWLRAFAAAGVATVAVDLRGHGTSAAPTDAASYAMTAFVADLDAVLTETGYERVDVFGYSMGARVALAFARARPERVGRLVLGGIGTRDLFASWNADDVDAVLLRDEQVDDAQVTSVLTTALTVPGASAAALSAVVRGLELLPEDRVPAADRVPRMPVLVIAGENDDLAPDAEALATSLSAEVVRVPGRGHFTVLTARGFREAILEFLARQT